MVVLKKLRASTLMETLVATVLIVIIFMLSSMLLNTIFSNTLTSRNTEVKEHMRLLTYAYTNESVTLPYFEQVGDWEYTISQQTLNNNASVLLKAENKALDASYTQIFINED